MTQPRTLLVGGLVLLLIAVACTLVLRAAYGQRPAYVHVRWTPSVDDAARTRLERAHGLTPVTFREQRTWLYLMTDVSRDSVRRLITDPAVEDTHYINRRFALIAWAADREPYRTTRPMWIAESLELAIRLSVLGGLAALLFGAYRAWQARGARPASAA